ncbi:hypothetical protein [Weissella halotolerans]|uniref:Uncharacterized protein n=1 Tax=Weissella halotolerans DSM 20190 TaxID=1123500 RepID=A0A0R2FYL7_9LACO|nr:hypothetical protein [Weissella halotolerans]KRN33554.1 hypothetical protein IV68_GL000360 [Weissella halotolerans DSM 20190]
MKPFLKSTAKFALRNVPQGQLTSLVLGATTALAPKVYQQLKLRFSQPSREELLKQLTVLEDLKQKAVLTDSEYQEQKEVVLTLLKAAKK